MASTQRRTVRAASERGLPSLVEARAERQRAIVLGRVRVRGMPPQFWLWAGVLLAVFAVGYWWMAQRELSGQKAAVMAKQRAIKHTLGPRIFPFRDKIERWAHELAGPWKADLVASDIKWQAIRSGSSVYLRLRLKNAEDRKGIAKAAAGSLHDGFTACFFVREGAPDPRSGPPCQSLADCRPGLLCNEWDVCAPPPRPYNMRLAYRALRVLADEWTDALLDAKSDLAVRVAERDLDAATKNDVPVAIEVLARAKYATIVLDEDPKGGLPPRLEDAGVETDEERVQRAGHAARVGIWDLRDGRLLVRVRRDAAGTFVPVGGRVVRRPETLAAQSRQANSCALATAVKEAVESVVVLGQPGP